MLVLEGQQALDIVQPSVHLEKYFQRRNSGEKDQEGLRRAGIIFFNDQ